MNRGLASIAMMTSGLIAWTRQGVAEVYPISPLAKSQIDDLLLFYFDTLETEDDASILITAPTKTLNKSLIPFKVEVPNSKKLLLVSDANPEPLIMAMEQVGDAKGTMIGRMRLQQTGILTCYALRNEKVRRASLRISVSGHW